MEFENKLRQKINSFLDQRVVENLQTQVDLIVREREELSSWSPKELRLAALAFKDDLAKGKTLDQLLVPAFAVVSESARRILGKVPYDVHRWLF